MTERKIRPGAVRYRSVSAWGFTPYERGKNVPCPISDAKIKRYGIDLISSGPLGQSELFRRLPEGDPVWPESCASQEIAVDRVHELASMQSGNYFVFDGEQRTMVAAERYLPDLVVGTFATVTKQH
jgi:hypothetical protein